MGLKKTAEERFFPRYQNVDPKFVGRFERPKAARILEAKVIDVGREGLGVLFDEALEKGETLELLLNEKRIAVSVVYCMDDLIHQGKFRCGLQRTGSNENLVSLFSAVGALTR